MAERKISPELAARLNLTSPDEWLEVIVELRQPDGGKPPADASRGGQIAALKSAFTEQVQSLSQILGPADAEILERAWIHQSLRIRIRARAISQLAQAAEIRLIDICRPIRAE